MKKIFLLIFTLLSVVSFAEDDPNIAYIDIPWSGSVSSERLPAAVTFSDGTTRSFYYWTFTEAHLSVEAACNGYEAKYNELLAAMLAGGKISDSQADANMSKWVDMVTPKLSIGIAEQQQKYDDRLNQLDTQWKSANESQKAVIETQYNNLLNESTAKINALQASYSTAVSGVIELQTAAITQLKGELNTANEQMRSATETLKNSLNASVDEINAAKAASEKAALRVAELSKTITELDKTSKGTQTTVIVGGGGVQYSSFTNFVSEIGRYLCNSNAIAHFRMPSKPNSWNGETLVRGDTIDNYLSEVGVVIRVDHKNINNWDSHPNGNFPSWKYNYGFIDERTLVNGKTNTLAYGIHAPYNWADGSTIMCTDGVYRVAEPFTTNTWNKLKKSLSALTNELFRAGGFTNTFVTVTNVIYGSNGVTNMPTVALNMDNALDNASIWTNGAKKIEIKGFNDAEHGTSPVVKIDDDTGVRSVEWKRPPVADSDAIWNVVGSESVQHRTLEASEEFLSPTNSVLTLYGFSDADNNQIPYKRKISANGTYELGWTNIVSGAGAPVDDASITTNTAHGAVTDGVASLYGFSTATTGLVPKKSASGKIEWGAVDGSALKFTGTDGASIVVGGGQTTNEVKFASKSDSNVEIKATRLGDDGVTITIGVYYR